MPLYSRPNSPHIWCRGSVAGRKYRCTSGTSDPAQAEEFEHALRDRMWKRHKLGDRGAVSFREAAQQWLKTLTNRTRRQDKANVEWFLSVPKLADATLNQIDLAALEELQALMSHEGRANATVNRMMGVMRRLLRKCCYGWRYIDTVPKVPMYKDRRREPRWLTPDEFARLLTHLPEHLQIAARFAVHTGLRESAMLSLTWAQVDMEGRRAWIAAEVMKAGKSHGFPLSHAAVAALKDAKRLQAEQEAQHAARCQRQGTRYVARPMTRVFTWRRKAIGYCNTKAYKAALAAAGISGANWHTLRHTFASWAVQSGVTLQELMQLGPWESYEMVLKYAHLAPDHLHKAVERVATMGHTASATASGRSRKLSAQSTV